jgi:hypothetical protein
VQITRYLSLSEPQFLGCVSAFVDSLFGELNSAAMYLRKLEGQPKGSAFAYEMSLDTHRYGALMVLDRWATLVGTYAPHLRLARHQSVIDETAGRVQTAENLLGRINDVIDATGQYTNEVVSACLLAWQSLHTTFAEERGVAGDMSKLGPMLPEEFRQARRVFLEDLGAR